MTDQPTINEVNNENLALLLQDTRIPEGVRSKLLANLKPTIFYKAINAFGSTFTKSVPAMEEHCLLFYAVNAHKIWSNEKRNTVYDGEENCLANYRQLYKSCCALYNVDPEKTLNAWIILETSAALSGHFEITELPNKIKYPYNTNGGVVESSIAPSKHIIKGAAE